MIKMVYIKKSIGSADFGSVDQAFYGKIENISDLVSFEANSKAEIRDAFHEVVDDYIELCHRIPKDIPVTKEPTSDNQGLSVNLTHSETV